MNTPISSKPPITFDLDGVICQPPFGVNVGISRDLAVPPLPASVSPRAARERQGLRHTLHLLTNTLRYFGRRPMPDAREGLLAVGARREPLLVTARSAVVLPFVEAWLKQHDLYDCFRAIYANDTALRSPQFKLHKVRALGASEHVDDDGATVYYLARHEIPHIYLRDWPRNRGLPYPTNVHVISSLLEVAEALARSG